ncbi:MAG: hypothetical protein WAV79_08910, partial [Anaerolineae bacterium]
MKSRLKGVPPGVHLRGRDVGRRKPTWRRHAPSPRTPFGGGLHNDAGCESATVRRCSKRCMKLSTV